MAYVPRTWSCGDKITANALNNIEDGIEEAIAKGGATVIHITGDDHLGYTADMTCDEIIEAINDGKTLVVEYYNDYYYMSRLEERNMPSANSKTPSRLITSGWLTFSYIKVASTGVVQFEFCFDDTCGITLNVYEYPDPAVVSDSIAVVHATGTPPNNLTLDMTCDEMADVIDSGGWLVMESLGTYFPLKEVNDNNRPQATSKGLLREGMHIWLTFSTTDISPSRVSETQVCVYNDCSVTMDEYTFTGN